MSNEETVGILNGLAHVIKEQVAANKARGDEIASLAAAVKDLTDFVGHSASSSGLRLPNLTLPEFTGNEDLDPFLEQFTNVLQASGTDFRHHFTYLKQQYRKDARAFGALGNKSIFRSFHALLARPTLKSILEMLFAPYKPTEEFSKTNKYGIYWPHITQCSNTHKRASLTLPIASWKHSIHWNA